MSGKLRAIVTGGAGFIGSHLVEGLLRRGYEAKASHYRDAGGRDRVCVRRVAQATSMVASSGCARQAHLHEVLVEGTGIGENAFGHYLSFSAG